MLTENANPSTAFLEMRITASKIGTTTGKPKTATNPKLLLVFDAIADIKVKEEAKPILPSIMQSRKRELSPTKLFINKE